MLEELTLRLLSEWSNAFEKAYFRYLSVNDEKTKLLLTQCIKDGSYNMSLFFKMGYPLAFNQVEGELTDSEKEVIHILEEESVDGWFFLGGKSISSLEYFLPEELLSTIRY